ncbi:MAG: hypothetical protein COB94_007110 [Gammaproteobacteria bacterium]|nr:hypothetical protein [Gammaproteobacteria bacterium]
MLCRAKPNTPQRGAALIVSLLILTVMTLLGVTAMSQSGLEALMAGNLQLQTSSMAQAENALTQSEESVNAMSSNATPFVFGDPTNKDDGYYRFDHDEVLNNINVVTQIQSAGSTGGFEALAGSTPAERYIVEYLGPRIIPGESITIGRETPRAGSEIHLFRNTALSFNNDNGSRRLVQSVFVTAEAP